MKRRNYTNNLTNEKILFPPTYMNSTSKNTFKIYNKNPDHFIFEWRRFATEAEEQSVLSGCDRYDPNGREIVKTILLFNSPLFKISPIQGDIWGNSQTEFLVEFCPTSPSIETQVAYLYNLQTKERIPYTFQGEGLPPSAAFNIQQINLGHIALDQLYEYNVKLHNTSLIPLEYQLIERTIPFPIIKFSPTHGHLNIDEDVTISIVVEANHVGQFNESFEFKILNIGDRKGPELTLFGRVIGPTFNISKKSIDFGTVSYGFKNSQELILENTSEIHFDYRFELFHDSTFDLREFNIYPDTGTIPSYSKEKIIVEFIPTSIKQYSVTLQIKSDKFSESLMMIPITANCICPDLTIVNPFLNLGELFLKYKYTANLVLKNSSKYPAKVEYVESDDLSNFDANVLPGKYSGVIPANSETEFPIYVEPIRLGHMSFVRFLKLAGNEESLMRFDIDCMCIGPKILFSVEKVDFGKVNILTDAESTFTITNDSLIEANFRVQIQSKTGVFSIKNDTGHIEPHESIDFSVFANLDDNVSFDGTLTFLFEHLKPIELNIHAKGEGAGIISSIDMKKIDLKCALTGSPIIQTFTIENVTRRPHELRWTQTKPNVNSQNYSTRFNFEVHPENIVLEPKSSADFTFSFFANGPCTFSLQPHCEATVSKKKSDVFKPKITGEFVKPYITFEKESLKFEYVHDTSKEEELTGSLESRSIISPSKELLQPMVYNNSITNMDDKVPLIMNTHVDPPFFIVPDTFTLEPSSTVNFDVIFKPEFKKDFTSQKIERKCIFSIEGNPQQYSINMSASMVFPNLSFQPESIHFGSILKDTEYNKTIHVTNISEVPVSFVWELLPKQKGIEIGKIFDISPIRGNIDVGNSIDIHITFFALETDNAFDGIAVCHIIGGPDYTIDLTGSSVTVDYEIGPKLFDFGISNLAQKLTKTICLKNKSDISLSYVTKIPKCCSISSIVVEPNEGTVEAGKIQQLTLTVIPGYPTFLKDSFIIQIGKIVDEEFTVQVEGIFPQIETTLPKENTEVVERDLLLAKLKELSTTPTFMNTIQLMSMTNFSKITKFNGISLSQFQIDFGKLVLGQTKSFEYSMKNVSPLPISFEIDVRSIESTGFQIEPHSFVDIQPDEEFQITVSFDAARRTKSGEGDEVYSIPILFSAGLASVLTIKSFISIPSIKLSVEEYEFDLTFVGQIRTFTFLVINSNSIPIEYTIENPYGETKPKSKKTIPQVFTASPKTGYLPPSSYQNVSISFSPVDSGDFSMEFPIRIKNCNEPKYFSVKGKGAQLKLKFEPNEMKFQSIHPFDESLTADIDIINPTEYPIDVFSPQFDLQIENAILMRKFRESRSDDDDQEEIIPVDNKLDTRVRPLSICVIINGPSKSGKTTMSNLVSKYLGDCPIISLKDLWKDLILNNCDDPNEYITLFSNEISNDRYCYGFVIDGLDAYPEPPETEAYLQTLMKQKHLTEELSKNSFAEASGDYRTSLEHVLYYVLEGLNGQFVFQIALQAKQDAILKHLPPEETANKSAENQEKEEMEAILKMSEDDYMKLSEEEQENIDKKRAEYRKKYLESQGIDLNALFTTPTPQTGKNSKKSLANSRRNASALKSSTSVASKPSVVRTPKKQPIGKNQLPVTSPYDFSILVFTYTLGRISNSIESNSDKFLVIDPIDAIQKSSEGSIGHHVNSILLDSYNSIEILEEQMKAFLPTLADIQQKVISDLLPEPTLFIPKYGYDEFGQVLGELELLPIAKQFSIINKEKPGDFPTFEKSKTTGKNSRRKSSRLSSNFTLTQNLDEMNFHKRHHIEPGQKETITIQFTSEEIGDFEDSIIFSIDNCKTVFYKLPISGKCLYPDVDRTPSSVFKSVVPSLNNRTRLSFVTDLNEFHFGPLLVAKERAKNQPYQYRQVMQFTNVTPFDSIITPFLRAQQQPKSPVWALEDTNPVTIQPGETKEIAICFHPVELSSYTSTVDLYIQDNPEPFSYTFVGEACAPSIELTPTTLDFEKILLKQVKTLDFTIKNTNKIPAIWKIAKPTQFSGIFTFSQVEGTIPPRGSTNVSVTFTSAKPQVIKKHLLIEVLDSTKQKTYQSVQVQLLAESFDVTFDFMYPKGMTNLEYGLMKCESTKSITCTLKNKGRYPSNFAFKCINKAIKRFMTIQPESGTISPNEKPLNIVFTFCSNKVVRINNENAVSLTIHDGISGTEMANINLTATIESLYNEYKLSLENDNLIDFGPLPTGKTSQREFKIENIGMFPFEFEFLPKIEVVEPPPVAQNVSRHGRKTTVRQPSPTRQKKGKLQTGPFTISPSSGTISPKESGTVIVEFGGPIPQQSDNSALLKIKDVSIADPGHDGLELHFKGETFSPGIEIGDVEKIFPKQNLCLRYDIMKNDTTAFLEDEQIFHFSPILIGVKRSVKVVLKNIYPVTCIIETSVKPANHKKKVAVFPFELSADTIEIPPLESREVELTFAPTVIGSFSGLFKAEVKGSSGNNATTLKFGVEGVAALPSISLLENESIVTKKVKETKPKHSQQSRSKPSSKIVENNPPKPVFDPNDMSAPTEATVSFGKTLVNTQKIKHINLKNESVIPAKITVMANNSPEFSIENLECFKEIELAPQRLLDIAVLYSPSGSNKSEFAMVIRVQDNHDSDISLTFVGEGSEEDIILEGIPGDDNNLCIKDTAVNKAQTATFIMRNVRNNDFRFAWHENKDFHFSPRVGHLRKLSSKTVKVTFSSDKPITYDKLKMICQLTKIELEEKNAPDWDDSMADIRFVARDCLLPQYGISPPLTADEKRKTARKFNSSKKMSTLRQSRTSSARRNRNKAGLNDSGKITPVVTEVAGDLVKVVEVKPEPPYVTLQGKCQDICLYASAVVDNISYELSDTEISFASTMMFETRTVEVTIKNTCNIRFDYAWQTTKYMTMGSDYALTHKSPFSIMPQSGFIESGNETVFKISFSPEEVDDFSSILVCDIPFLADIDPPMVHVTGISTRPLCHFRVELSDYISAGRRHPDYTYTLPDDVRVIELFTSRIGKRALKKFQVINTTSHPYEVVWKKDPNNSNDSIICETPVALVSSGTAYPMAFSYLPTSVKTVESFWTFTIPEHHVSVPFLFVGRLMPK